VSKLKEDLLSANTSDSCGIKKIQLNSACLCEDQCLGDFAMVTDLTKLLVSCRTGSSPAGSSTDILAPAVPAQRCKAFSLGEVSSDD
jgi:hypothetical protein